MWLMVLVSAAFGDPPTPDDYMRTPVELTAEARLSFEAGLSAVEAGELAAARTAFETAATQAPKSCPIFYNLAQIHMEERSLDHALTSYTRYRECAVGEAAVNVDPLIKAIEARVRHSDCDVVDGAAVLELIGSSPAVDVGKKGCEVTVTVDVDGVPGDIVADACEQVTDALRQWRWCRPHTPTTTTLTVGAKKKKR